MQLITAVSVLLLTSNAVAAPFSSIRAERSRARRASGRHGNPLNRIDHPELTNETNVEYSSNWSGAILVGTGYKSVTATFTVPSPSTAGSGSAWVGIDGDTCDTAILQTGIDWTKSGSSITYDAWYEWYPDYAYDFSSISLAAGNTITVTVTASSKTGGTAVIKNVSTGTTVTHTFSNEGSIGDLCEYNAEWIVEDFEEAGSLVSFANFGTVAFTGASATSGSGSVGVTGATLIDIEQNSKVLTSVTTPSSSEVLITYV